MKVCIGITTKNRCDILPKSIQSALQQDYRDKEVVIFNDGSTDRTGSVKEEYPEVRWMQSEKSVGLLAARNALMNSTDADLYVTLDDDAWFLKGDEIRLAVDEFLKDDKLAVVGFDILQRGTKRFNPIERSSPIVTNVFIGCGAMLKLSAVLESGNFVAFPVRYGHEEKDLSIRMIDKGYSLLFMPGVHIWHDFTPIERNLESQRTALITNDLIFQYRRVPTAFVWIVLANNILRKLRSNDDPISITKKGINSFFAQLSSQKDKINRVKPSTYWKYRRISKSFLAFKNDTDQTGNELTSSIQP